MQHGPAKQAVLLICLALGVIGYLSANPNPNAPGAKRELWAATPDIRGIDFWGEAEGLTQSRIRAIVQTRDAYLWLGTDYGLVRFNGTSFTAFTVETGSLRDNEVWAIQEDDEGGLWVGTYGGGLTLLKGGVFKTFTTADGLPDDVVTELSKDREGNIWLGTPRGAARYSHGVFTQFTTADGLAENSITAICADAAGVWLATSSNLHRFINGKISVIKGVIETSDGQLDHLAKSRDGSIWLGFRNAVIKKWKDGHLTTFTTRENPTQRINQLYEDSEGTLWVALRDGVARLRDAKFEPVSLGDGNTGLGVVYSIFRDREDNIWVGFQSNGLARLRTKQLFTISKPNGLPNESTRTVFQDSKGTLWIGTANGFTGYKNGSQVTYQAVNRVPIGSVKSIAEDSAGNLWIGAEENLFILAHSELRKIPGWRGEFEVRAIYRDQKGHMWVGTDGDGLFEYDSGGGSLRHFTTRDGLASDQVRTLLVDRSGTLWIGTHGRGVSKYENGAFVNYTKNDGLAGSRVSASYQDEDGALWFATRDGLSRFKDGKFFNFTSENGLLVSFVYSMLDDGRGNFWFSCAQGLFRVSKSELRDFADGKLLKLNSIDYGVRDGMKTRAYNVGNQPSAWKTNDGELMFCSMRGVVVVDPNRLYSSGLVPPVHIEKVVINKQQLPWDASAQLPVGSGEVEIHYAALSYVSPEKVRFKYMLEGFDKEWVDAGVRRFAYYANLPPGQYKFHVSAGYLDGPWNESGTSFAFYLKPRFYQTPIFVGLVIATALFLAFLLYKLRMMELKARYSAVLGERNRIAREIHDTLAQNLAGIALQLESVSMQTTDMPASLSHRLDQACNLVRYSLSEARRAVSDLRADELERHELAAELPEIAAKMAASASAEAKVQVMGTPRRLSPVIEKNLLRIFQEAMANAVKHAAARNIDIKLRYDADRLLLSVQDDGSGFDTENIIPLGVGHYGLTGMRERAERIGGRLTLKSQLGQGTHLLVEVPL
ncbi:MAG TPA: two-component regulator propeller domain-containing protein [Pyrinomonadaceae bacterium]|nr:two-component regulator propeller domain-containing protein [Pyrinomonadaceae bacterium]